jgi:signal transduction histidine kinase
MDETLVAVVFTNLIENAIKFSDPGSSILCTVTEAAGGARFEITDTGPGISLQEQPKIFEFFYRAPEHQSRAEGVGVGLAICKKIVDLHRGDLTVKSGGRGS